MLFTNAFRVSLLLGSIAGISCAPGAPPITGAAPSKPEASAAAPPPVATPSVGPLPAAAPSAAPSAEVSMRRGKCWVDVPGARGVDQVPDLAVVLAVLPAANARGLVERDPDPARPAWRDCHGQPNAAGSSAPAILETLVLHRLLVEDHRLYAWIRVGGVEGVLARLELQGDRLTATHTEPDLNRWDGGSRGLLHARLGETELLFVPREGNAADVLDVHPTGPAHAEVWEAYVPRSDAELFQVVGRIVTGYMDAELAMRAVMPWRIERDRILLEEHWTSRGPKGGSGSSTRAYRMKAGVLAPESRNVAR